jgi:hypothetical protein
MRLTNPDSIRKLYRRPGGPGENSRGRAFFASPRLEQEREKEPRRGEGRVSFAPSGCGSRQVPGAFASVHLRLQKLRHRNSELQYLVHDFIDTVTIQHLERMRAMFKTQQPGRIPGIAGVPPASRPKGGAGHGSATAGETPAVPGPCCPSGFPPVGIYASPYL